VALATLIFIIVLYTAITVTFFVDSALGLVNILWYYLLVMLALFTMGRLAALILGVLCMAPCGYYVLFLMYDNFHTEKLYQTGNLVMVWLTCGLGLYLVYYITNQFMKSKEVAELGLKETNKELETQNDVIFRQKEEKELMLKEIHHRVKNNLQIVSSLLRFQSREVEDPKIVQMFEDAQNRIISMAMIHEKMYSTEDLKNIDIQEHFTSLIEDLVKGYSVGNSIRLDVRVSKVDFGLKTLVPLGLVVNEIVNNSLKHAFDEGESGMINLNLRQVEGQKFEMMIGDNGAGFRKQENLRGLGTELIEIFVTQLEGTVEKFDNGGTQYVINFEVAN
jgi:two-component sensor histidine kinase